MMVKHKLFAVLILTAIALMTPMVYAQTLQKPNVTLPAGWNLEDETAYPDSFSEYDPVGAGMLQYINPENGDEVKIFYEKAQATYNSPQLKDEAIRLFNRDQADGGWEMRENGTREIAGVNAGFAKGYHTDYDAYVEDIVFVKGEYYINAIAVYDATAESETETLSIINSISVDTSLLGDYTIYIIIGLAAAVVLLIIVVFVVRKKRKRITAQMPQTEAESYPPPPA